MNSSPEMNAWSNCALEDLWIFDKLLERLGIWVR